MTQDGKNLGIKGGDSSFELKYIIFYKYAIYLESFHILSSNIHLQLSIWVYNLETQFFS